jgi:hypothetical protein
MVGLGVGTGRLRSPPMSKNPPVESLLPMLLGWLCAGGRVRSKTGGGVGGNSSSSSSSG